MFLQYKKVTSHCSQYLPPSAKSWVNQVNYCNGLYSNVNRILNEYIKFEFFQENQVFAFSLIKSLQHLGFLVFSSYGFRCWEVSCRINKRMRKLMDLDGFYTSNLIASTKFIGDVSKVCLKSQLFYSSFNSCI